MSAASHKYMSQEISDAERAATFAARHETLDFILGRLRADGGKLSFNSFHIVGARGAGKTTLLHMVRQRINTDATLSKHWLPVILPEELVSAGSLRDFLSAVLEQLAEDGNKAAAQWREKCEREEDQEASEQIACAGLAALAREARRVLLVGVENFDRVLAQVLSTSRERATLRRLMIDEPFVCLLATSTILLPSDREYDDPLFGHFETIELPRLNDAAAHDLLNSHALYRKDDAFLARYRKARGIVRTLTRLTGGNPRLLLMLYDVVALKEIELGRRSLACTRR